VYLQRLSDQIRALVPNDQIPADNADALFLAYAVLARTKGTRVSDSDVHDAWSAWIHEAQPDHESLVPFADLDDETAAQDAVFTAAIRAVAAQQGETLIARSLFPSGVPLNKGEASGQMYDLYKLMVASSEALVARRQGVNTFFMTINGVLLTALSLIGGSVVRTSLGALGICFLALTGALLSFAWRSLIRSFGQLNTGKFAVINEIERHLDAAVYAAEWEALERGENPEVYRSFTSREVWVPNTLAAIYVLTAVVALLVATGVIGLT
jgi:hypothetical protein